MAFIQVKAGYNVITDDFSLSPAQEARLSREYKRILVGMKLNKRFRKRRVKAKRLPRHKQSLAPVVYGLHSLNDPQFTREARDSISMRQWKVQYLHPSLMRSFKDQFGGHYE